MIEYHQTIDAQEATPRLLRKIVEQYARRGRRYLTRRARRHERQVGVAIEAVRLAYGDSADVHVTRLADDVTAIRLTTDVFGAERVVNPTIVFRLLRDRYELTGIGWLGKLHGGCVVIHTDRGRQEWGKP